MDLTIYSLRPGKTKVVKDVLGWFLPHSDGPNPFDYVRVQGPDKDWYSVQLPVGFIGLADDGPNFVGRLQGHREGEGRVKAPKADPERGKAHVDGGAQERPLKWDADRPVRKKRNRSGSNVPRQGSAKAW